jgi:hypothetical protein
MGLQVTENAHDHVLERDINAKSHTIMWAVLFVKDGRVLAKLPDVIIHDDKEKMSLLIGVVLPDDSNLDTKETERT